MDVFVGLVTILAVAYVVRALHRLVTRPYPVSPRPAAPHGPPSPGAPTRQPGENFREREDEAFVDGALIGSYFFGDFWKKDDTHEDATDDHFLEEGDDEQYGDEDWDDLDA